MKRKLIALLAGILTVQRALALGQCPAEVKSCGPNPFYVLVIGFPQVCSEKFPENAPSYKATLVQMVAESPTAYAKIDADAEFQEKLQMLLRETEKMPLAELQSECARLLQEAQKSVTVQK